MSDLEQIRSSHEELEVYHQVLLHELSRHPRSKRQIVFQDHKLRHVSESAHKRARLLVDLHQDKHKLLANECKALQNQKERFPKFYRELQDINKFHAANHDLMNPTNNTITTRVGDHNKNDVLGARQFDKSNGWVNPSNNEGAANVEEAAVPALFSDLGIPESGASLVEFSGEEYFGRYLDLHTFFSRYKNLPGAVTDLKYEKYVEAMFYDVTTFPATTKTQRRYSQYVNDLLEYVQGFVLRTRPLTNHTEWKRAQIQSFEMEWSKGNVPGWSDGKADLNVVPTATDGSEDQAEDLQQYATAVDMEKVGLEKLKKELIKRGVKCGGTLTDRAERLFSIRDLKDSDIPKQLKAKKKRAKRPRGGPTGNSSSSSSSSSSSTTSSSTSSASPEQSLAQSEWLLYKSVNILLKVELADTLRHLERKKTRTHTEMNREMYDELKRDDEEGADGMTKKEVGSDDEEEEANMMYNPKGLPLGWDGKPIPFWLYRLHGLSKSFKCEICGNHTYWGRKEFDIHFQEARHQHGMKCLKIPNTSHFHGITGISDALALYAKLKVDIQTNFFDSTDQEEFEDSAGNVMNKASYEDLKKQGLL
jgi:splicing factor 3A subunit 3